ncbi:MAG TPA: hypothetical protein VKQ70_15165 [Caulobacteraceae bacterium]|nr:hypothetical protein [Caulobacteraceae bacterium]
MTGVIEQAISRLEAHAKARRERNHPHPPGVTLSVADLEIGKVDQLGCEITEFFGFKPPEYAVYGTQKRVSIQFADQAAMSAVQRKAMAPLNPVRGEINGLINGWRLHPPRSSPRRRAERYDRRVGDALVVAFESDPATAQGILEGIKQDIRAERLAWAQFQYLLCAFAAAAFAVIILGYFGLVKVGRAPIDLETAGLSGAVGAFFSIALGLRGRTVLIDLQWLSNAMDAVLRVVIGVIAAGVLMALVESRAVTLGIGDARLGGGRAAAADVGAVDSNAANTDVTNDVAANIIASNATAESAANPAVARPTTATRAIPAPIRSGSGSPWLYVLIVGFVAGFSERFVPDLLARVGPNAGAGAAGSGASGSAAQSSAGAPPAAPPAAAAAPAGAPSPPGTDVDPHPEESVVDNCASGAPLSPDMATRDEDLPPASGGVAQPVA